MLGKALQSDHRSWLGLVIIAALTLITLSLIHLNFDFIFGNIIDAWWLRLAAIAFVLLLIRSKGDLPWLLRAAAFAVMIVLVFLFSRQVLEIIYLNVEVQREWDFLAFWLDGRVAASHLNFYLPESYQFVAQGMEFSQDFYRTILQAGFRYPPPTILLFLPFGFFELSTSYLLWYVVSLIFLSICTVMITKYFWHQVNVFNLLTAALSLLLLHASILTFWFGQSTFIALLLVLLFWVDRERPRAGVWIVLAAAVKPLLACLIVYLILKRQWRAVGRAIITGLVLLVIVALLFGPSILLDYFKPGLGMPDEGYTELTNQSLLGEILRDTHYDFTGKSPLTSPVYIGASILIGLITVWLCYRMRDSSEYVISLLLLMALLLYPGTRDHYAILLIIPILTLWKYRESFRGRHIAVAAFIILLYILDGYHDGTITIYAIATCWLAFSVIGFAIVSGHSNLVFGDQQTNVFSDVRQEMA